MAEAPPPAKIISKDSFRRLVKDVKELVTSPLHTHGIYYVHNEDNILTGKALIIGPSETPYENGYYLFDFDFPVNYPHAPPEVKYRTNDGQTRFNPNLYTQGKVCLSVLNTWQGDQWTGCQTISSTLLAICSILNNEPLLNEPGINKSHKDFEKYNTIITYKNFEVAILQMLTCPMINEHFAVFTDIMKTHYVKQYEQNLKRLQALAELYPKKEQIQTGIYNMTVTLNYKKLLTTFNNLLEKGWAKNQPWRNVNL